MKWLAVVAGLSLALFVVPATQVAAAGTSSACARPSRPFAYHWPIKPFETQHPVRGGFGDPRIVSLTQPFGWTGPHQTSAYSFHNGIDIGAAPGTPVYPVVSGRVVRATEGQIVVRTDDGRSFQYYHLWRAPAVQKARCVVARRTVLGWITEKRGHLHLAEIDGSVVHNPLDRGHLEPYHDRTRPAATELYLDDGTQPTRTLDGRPIGPRDLLAVHVTEPPPMPMPGEWFDLPQVPTLVEWRLFHGDTRTAWRTAVDFRHTEPPPRAFWEIYGAGTYQNCPQFEHHNYLTTPGRYLIRLRIHPSRLHAGLYRIAVRVADIRGNRSTAWWSIRIVH
jgi:Peptidase family M23